MLIKLNDNVNKVNDNGNGKNEQLWPEKKLIFRSEFERKGTVLLSRPLFDVFCLCHGLNKHFEYKIKL